MTSVREHIKRFLSILAGLVVLCGCEENLSDTASGEALLQVRLCAPDYNVEVRSVSSDPDSPELWTSWERAVDGRFIYRASAFLLQGSRLVAHEDIEVDDQASEVTLDFEGNFTHGTYTLMVVANYSAFEAEDGKNGTRRYEGLTDLSSTVQNILQHGGIDNFTNIYADSFLNYKVSSEQGICAKVPQPLTLVKDIELHPGINKISGELVRTYSRIRITVENNSDEDLYLSSMDFSDVFTQSSAYLFEGKGFINSRTDIEVSSSNAITPFAGTDDSPLAVPAKGSSVVFDAYILESRRNSTSETYSYTLGLGYDETNSYVLKSTTAKTKREDISSGYYIIYSRGASRYLTAGTNSVQASTLGILSAGMQIPQEYIWTLDNTGLRANQYYIGTATALDSGQTSYYISNPSRNSVTLGANKSVYFTFANKSSYISLQSSGSGSYKYLSVSGSSAIGQGNANSNNSVFAFYPVDVPMASKVEVPVSTINNVTGQSTQVTQIDRNDFINAVVKVSYSKNQGHFSFEVKEWESAGGDVTFN